MYNSRQGKLVAKARNDRLYDGEWLALLRVCDFPVYIVAKSRATSIEYYITYSDGQYYLARWKHPHAKTPTQMGITENQIKSLMKVCEIEPVDEETKTPFHSRELPE